MSINRFHWILLVIKPESGRCIVFDSLRINKKEYMSLIHEEHGILQKAWRRFTKIHIGVTTPEHKHHLEIRTDFPVWIPCIHMSFLRLQTMYINVSIRDTMHTCVQCLRQAEGNNLCRYYVCEFMRSFTQREK